jgi:hypothetical protein
MASSGAGLAHVYSIRIRPGGSDCCETDKIAAALDHGPHGTSASRGRALRLAAQRSNRRQGILTSGTITLLRAMIEDAWTPSAVNFDLQQKSSQSTVLCMS